MPSGKEDRMFITRETRTRHVLNTICNSAVGIGGVGKRMRRGARGGGGRRTARARQSVRAGRRRRRTIRGAAPQRQEQTSALQEVPLLTYGIHTTHNINRRDLRIASY